MKVILLENVKRIGSIGEIIDRQIEINTINSEDDTKNLKK